MDISNHEGTLHSRDGGYIIGTEWYLSSVLCMGRGSGERKKCDGDAYWVEYDPIRGKRLFKLCADATPQTPGLCKKVLELLNTLL